MHYLKMSQTPHKPIRFFFSIQSFLFLQRVHNNIGTIVY